MSSSATSFNTASSLIPKPMDPIKIKKSATDDELVELGKTQLKHGRCYISSEERDMSKTISAPNNAVAIIVDISAPGGKFVIGRYGQVPWGIKVVTERATEGETHLLIWPWHHEWQFYAIGSTKIRYLVEYSTAT